ncbi:MAG: hypothetical protein JSV65_04800 [Armatimonadota bacterium]|nr:MAG: hypothetical protein JSV65_04800 [Armatimonadota bacterium]
MRLTLIAPLIAILSYAAVAQQGGEKERTQMFFNVLDYGAQAGGEADCTAAVQAALDAAAEHGGIVQVPGGRYLIKGHLSVPDNVTLEGTWRAPARSIGAGSVLLAVEGAGDPDGEPFITLHTNSTLRGIAVLYPDQVDENPPKAYPWCVRGIGDDCSIIDCLLVNPYQAVDFGTFPAGRHYINGLYSQALYRGIFVDKCFDVGRIENVHLWPFWMIGGDSKARQFTLEQGEAFIFGRTDWEYVTNCFCIAYKVGFRFVALDNGPGNVVLTQSGSDVGPTAVLVDAVQGHAGIAFNTSQFMATVVVKETNSGPVKFNNCGFWPVNETVRQADLKGGGHVTFNACHFAGWDRQDQGEPCIYADCDGLTVSSCDFMDEDKAQITLGPNLRAGIIMGNRFRGGEKVRNESQGDVQMGLNVGQ